MFNHLNFVLAFIILVTLSACSAPGVKPEDANLLEAAVNISSGEFDSQLSREKFKLKSAQDTLKKESSKNQNLNKQLQVLTAQKKVLDRQLVMLQSENNLLIQQANKTKAISKNQQAERNNQIKKIKALNLSIKKLRRKKATVRGNKRYKSQISALKNEINVLRKMINNQ